jgi:hypothetical protein
MSHGGRHDPLQDVNDDHAGDLLVAARAIGGHPDAVSARARRIDDAGIDLTVDTPRGRANVRLDFTASVAEGDSRALRAAFGDLVRRARSVLAADSYESDAPWKSTRQAEAISGEPGTGTSGRPWPIVILPGARVCIDLNLADDSEVLLALRIVSS